MPNRIFSKAQWRKLAATMPEEKFKEMVEGVNFDKLPEHVEDKNSARRGRIAALDKHLARLRGRLKKR